MHPYIILLIASAIVNATLAGALLSSRSRQTDGRLAAALLGCGVVWASTQALWCSAGTAESALAFARMSGLGWVPIPAFALHLVLKSMPHARPRLRRFVPWMYAITLGFIVLDMATPLIHADVVRTSWGWAFVLGDGFVFAYAWIFALASTAIWLGVSDVRASPSAAERSQTSILAIGLLVPGTVASLTDGLLPMLGVRFPYLGSVSVAFVGIVGAYSAWRYGYSLLVPTAFTEQIVDTLPEGIAMTHLDGRIRSSNAALQKLSGRDQRSLQDVPIQQLLTLSLEVLSDGLRDEEAELSDAHGGLLPVVVTSKPLLDNRGLCIGLVIVVQDQRELVTLRSRLLLSGRLAAVGELAAGVAHEINNPLAYVRANVSLLGRHMKAIDGFADDLGQSLPDAEARRAELRSLVDESGELLEEALEGVDRAVSIVRDIRGFSHGGSGERETVDFRDLLESVLRVAAPQLGSRVRVERDFAELPRVACAPQEIKQVFLNVILNASQAIEGDGLVRIEAEADEARVTVRIRDDGVGIPVEVRDRVFDPFFTTKAVGEGTGIGLAISYEIVRRHGGAIALNCPEAGGTCAEIQLPITPVDAVTGAETS